MKVLPKRGFVVLWLSLFPFVGEANTREPSLGEQAMQHFERYCFDCHDDELKKGNLDLMALIEEKGADYTLPFEHLITAKMPPEDKKQPSAEEKQVMLDWLAKRQAENNPDPYRRISRHEFVHSANDLLGVQLDLTGEIPEDRGTNDFDSDRRIKLTKEMLASYFQVADEMLEFALPRNGFVQERIWVTNKIKVGIDSHRYTRKYKEGLLFSWSRANNGHSQSFFYDNFDPPEKGWYELTFDAMKLGDFPEDISIEVFAGKYYHDDARNQPQRLLEVISLGNREMKSHTMRVFLFPGENVSVHCYSKHNYRQKNGNQGAYIKQLKVRGPVLDQWPPSSYQNVFGGLPMKVPPRKAINASVSQTKLKAIGGNISVSSFQKGMEKEKMQDGSNRTFWHTRFKPTLAKPPHYVILENPKGKQIDGLSYATWSGGNGNGQVQAFAIHLSDDGKYWGDPVLTGPLAIHPWGNEQPILFPKKTTKRFIKFLITEAHTLDGRSLASIGKLDVMTTLSRNGSTAKVTVSSRSPEDLKQVVKRFAEQAFSSSLGEEDLAPYYQASLDALQEGEKFVEAAKIGLKAILCSHRFLMAPGEHSNPSYTRAADLARILWLSVPDDEMLRLSKTDKLSAEAIPVQVDRMIKDPRSRRMIHSFCNQWLDLRSFNKVAPSLKLYPLYNDLLNHFLPLETEAYLDHLIQENLPVDHLIDADFSFLNQRLAQHYGIPGIYGQNMRKVSFEPDVPRGGLMTMGSVLKVTADGFDTSPILRGAWISKNIAGNTLSPPPESVEAIEPEHGKEAATLREQIEEHRKNPACYACHKSIDPYGFALESFDATGQWRTQYRVKLPHPRTFQYRPKGYFKLAGEVDAAGEIDKDKFADVFGLKKILLSDHKKIAYNFIKKFFEYANGYQPSLKQRLDLFAMIPDDPEECRMKGLITKTLVYSLKGQQQ